MDGKMPEGSGSWLWPCCQDCQRWEGCPYYYDQLLSHAARRGQAEAQRLAGKADRFLETISCSNDLQSLLDGSGEIVQALSHGLSAEMEQVSILCAQTAKHCP